MRVTLWVDGSVDRNDGHGTAMGYGAVGAWSGGRRAFSGSTVTLPGEATNNRAELGAMVFGLQRFGDESARETDLILRSDSQWAVRSVTGVYNGSANRDLIDAVQAELKRFNSVLVEWRRGHDGDPDNERAHELASAAMKKACRVAT